MQNNKVEAIKAHVAEIEEGEITKSVALKIMTLKAYFNALDKDIENNDEEGIIISTSNIEFKYEELLNALENPTDDLLESLTLIGTPEEILDDDSLKDELPYKLAKWAKALKDNTEPNSVIAIMQDIKITSFKNNLDPVILYFGENEDLLINLFLNKETIPEFYNAFADLIILNDYGPLSGASDLLAGFSNLLVTRKEEEKIAEEQKMENVKTEEVTQEEVVEEVQEEVKQVEEEVADNTSNEEQVKEEKDKSSKKKDNKKKSKKEKSKKKNAVKESFCKRNSTKCIIGGIIGVALAGAAYIALNGDIEVAD